MISPFVGNLRSTKLVRENVQYLREHGYQIIQSASGYIARDPKTGKEVYRAVKGRQFKYIVKHDPKLFELIEAFEFLGKVYQESGVCHVVG